MIIFQTIQIGEKKPLVMSNTETKLVLNSNTGVDYTITGKAGESSKIEWTDTAGKKQTATTDDIKGWFEKNNITLNEVSKRNLDKWLLDKVKSDKGESGAVPGVATEQTKIANLFTNLAQGDVTEKDKKIADDGFFKAV